MKLQLDAVTFDAQRRAADPANSSWVSANAGSGKTHVLVQRVKRLLLEGVAPDKILCLTFTKAAAANMSNRVLAELSDWVKLDDTSLRDTLARIDGQDMRKVSDTQLRRARRLFALALETPGGLKIQTIHAFCDALLHQFPFEAGLAAKFQVMDDAQKQLLIREGFDRILNAPKSSPEYQALIFLQTEMRPDGIKDAVEKYYEGLQSFFKILDKKTKIYTALGINSDECIETLHAQILNNAIVASDSWYEAAQQLQSTGHSYNKDTAEKLLYAYHAAGEKKAEAYLDVFLTKDKKFRSPSRIVSKDFSTTSLGQNLLAEPLRLEPLYQKIKLHKTGMRTHAFVTLSAAVWCYVDAIKKQQGLVDFSEMVKRASLLVSGEASAWVRYKLDQGVDHILVDEAQDTSDAQWQVITGLAQEFFSGEGAKENTRTLFAVGDDKQSIFSFQGAVPERFEQEKRRVATLAKHAQKPFEDVLLNLSFRSSPILMKSVDTIFSRDIAAAGVTNAQSFPPHEAAKRHLPGRIEIWPLEIKSDLSDTDGFSHPFENDNSESPPRLRLAQRVAQHIQSELNTGSVYEGDAHRPIRPSDILILVRTRGPLFEMLLREMKRLNLPVAGADRLVLNEHIAAIDLISLAQAILLPEDDLNFASLLKSPLLAFDDDDLFSLCHKRSSSLSSELESRAYEKPHWHAAQTLIAIWRERAKSCRPYEFFARVLGEDRGRVKFYNRLGREAGEVLDEFLNAALNFELSEIPTLQNFVKYFHATRSEIKREMEQGDNTIRVMTAHGAKGLEAKWVILADTVDMPSANTISPFYDLDSGSLSVPVWAPKKDLHVGVLEQPALRASRMQGAEYRRLLYVALTRAEQKLTVCGAETHQKIKPESWYALISDALLPNATPVYHDDQLVAHVIEKEPFPEIRREAQDLSGTPSPPDYPAWLFSRAFSEPQKVHLKASGTSDADDFLGEEQKRIIKAKLRGSLLHRLLEYLPSLKKENWPKAATQFLSASAENFSTSERQDLIDEVLNVLQLPLMQKFIGADSKAEVPIAANVILADGREASFDGQIDRLVITPEHISILDFKSGHAPANGRIPEAYTRQLGLYREALRQVYPSRTISCYVLWTKEPRLDEIEPDVLEAALLKVA